MEAVLGRNCRLIVVYMVLAIITFVLVSAFNIASS